ncbi:hypothetical protein, partial [Burkholderia pseudomallei]|uniref:hypothetical protein n=1 Tax=Burkholderia pseudomallei TaxID=28450 RepID=UPI001C82E82A
FFGKPALLHDFLFSVGSHSLKFQLVRKFQGRSNPVGPAVIVAPTHLKFISDPDQKEVQHPWIS